MFMKNKYIFILIILLLITQGFSFNRTEENDDLEVEKNTEEKEAEVEERPPEREAVYIYQNQILSNKQEEIINKVIKLKYISSENVINVISRVVPKIIIVSKDLNTIILRGESENIQEALTIIDEIF